PMPEFLPGSVFSGILTIAAGIVLRARAGKPGLSGWKLGLIGIAAAYVIPWALALLAEAWRATPLLPALPVVTFDQMFIGALVALALLSTGHRSGRRPLVPLWVGLLTGVAFAVLLPPLLDLM